MRSCRLEFPACFPFGGPSLPRVCPVRGEAVKGPPHGAISNTCGIGNCSKTKPLAVKATDHFYRNVPGRASPTPSYAAIHRSMLLMVKSVKPSKSGHDLRNLHRKVTSET